MNTKERIWDEALTLFSQKGYSGTSVKEIAEAVGIKDSSLYKHYKSKQEIFDTIVAEAENKMTELSELLRLPDMNESQTKTIIDRYGKISMTELLEISQSSFLFYLENPFFMRLRRMLNREQYGNPEVYLIYRKIFMEDSIAYLTDLFQILLQANIFHGNSAQVLAIEFYSPIFFLLAKYDARPDDREEALKVLGEHISEFARLYDYHR